MAEVGATVGHPAQTAVTVDAQAHEGQAINHGGSSYTTIREGLAHILVPTNAPTTLDTKKHQQAQKEGKSPPSQSVFYNPIQQFNRDLSVVAVKVYSEHVLAVREFKARLNHEKFRKKQRVREEKGRQDGQQDVSKEDGKPEERGCNAPASLKRKADEALGDDDSEANPAKRRKEALSEKPSPQHDNKANIEEGTRPIDEDVNGIHDDKSRRQQSFQILDALSATGLRALRYAKEVPAATSVVANDLSPDATASIKMNVEHNRLGDRIKVTTGNATSHMYNCMDSDSTKYDVVDLDPYGTAVPFLDSAIQALKDGGLLCVTCTDAGVWASNGYPEKTFSLYGGNPIKGRHSHEGGLRLILNSIATAAARYGIAIEPLLSLSIDFYARLFVRIRRSPEQVKFLAGKTMVVYNCDSGCGAFATQLIGRNEPVKAKNGQTIYKHGMAQGPSCKENCRHCGFKTHVAGPMWAGPLHNVRFLERLLESVPQLDPESYKTRARLEGMVSTALEEIEVEDYPDFELSKGEDATDDRVIPCTHRSAVDRHPFFFTPSVLAGIIHCQAPAESAVKGALRGAGYTACRSHIKPESICTNAPWDFLWEMMREWVRQRAPLKENALKPSTAGYAIMQSGSTEQGESNEASPDRITRAATESAEGPTKGGAKGEQSKTKITFDEALGREYKRRRKIVRYQANPRENWGPMSKARG